MRKDRSGQLRDTFFPPRPLTQAQTHRILTKHCRTMRPKAFIEAGCAVCGRLVPQRFLTPLVKYQGSLALLCRPGAGVTRKERFSSSDPILEIEGPVLASGCSAICVDCET
ncbi:hypothetical protein DFH09DRAFT_939548, partial [Mycena vulgaris]